MQVGFQLYEAVVKPNELGLSPEVYEIFKTVIEPNMKIEGPDDPPHISRKEILECYFHEYRRPLSYKRLDKELLPALTGAGIIYEDIDPKDRRRKLIYLTYEETDQKLNTPVLGGKTLLNNGYIPNSINKGRQKLPHPLGVFNSTEATEASEKSSKDPLKKVRKFTSKKGT